MGKTWPRLARARASGRRSEVIDGVGPETFTFETLVRLIAESIGSRARIIHVPPALMLGASRVIGYVVKDTVATKDQLGGLMRNLAVTDGPRPVEGASATG